ncbi:hypothetical protein [Longimicrobium sp.]|uniref:hypothetical protein n=1 Tax=Longimicrobium sp. TaxID=2029185 RepID=UPI002E3306C8|nr:hypothetical protein [Longimicrobium sp.]HEX6039427.1 hypothetical protein [Longimicrobium sp.]
MPAKKKLPWRAIVTSSEEQVGRINRQEARKIFQELRELREARKALARQRARSGGVDREP